MGKGAGFVLRVAIVGSRGCDKLEIDDVIVKIPRECSAIISGGAQGVDALAKLAAQQLKIPLIQILPEYARYGKRAPIIRNAEIVKQADLVLAFWDYESRGTASVLQACIEQQVPFEIIGIAETGVALDPPASCTHH